MSVSYLPDLEQLSALAYYEGIDSFPGLPALPKLGLTKSGEVIKKLIDLGMLCPRGEYASVDFGLAFVLSVMARPKLLIRVQSVRRERTPVSAPARPPVDILCYCTDRLGVMVSPDAHRKQTYRITPLPDASELAERVWVSAEEAMGAGADACAGESAGAGEGADADADTDADTLMISRWHGGGGDGDAGTDSAGGVVTGGIGEVVTGGIVEAVTGGFGEPTLMSKADIMEVIAQIITKESF